MGKKFFGYLACIVVVLIIPYLITTMMIGDSLSDSKQGEVKIYLKDAKNTVVTLDEYLTGTLAANSSMEYEEETLKAQAVILRTWVYAALKAGKETLNADEINLSYTSDAQMRQQYSNDQYIKYKNKIKQAISSTDGEVIEYNGVLITPLFHQVNAGETRSYEAVYGEKRVYLSSVKSNADYRSKDAMRVTEFKTKDVIERLNAKFDLHLTEDHFWSDFVVNERDEFGYVLSFKAGDEQITGEEFRTVLGLNSCNLYFEKHGENMSIVTKGKGDGIGFSQYGANEMAKEKHSYKELLSYYYKGIQVIKLEN